MHLADHVGPLDPERLQHPWISRDPEVDTLQRDLMKIVEVSADASRQETFLKVWERAHGAGAPELNLPDRRAIPFLTEPWYC